MRTPKRNDLGFSLIEMLIVLAIVSILAMIALPTLGSSTEKAHLAAMRSDLRSIAVAQEAYMEQQVTGGGNGGYAGKLNQLDVGTSGGVKIRLRADADGWSAEATHTRTKRKCAVFRGGIKAFAPATTEGTIACTG